jgi:ribosomal protein S24E
MESKIISENKNLLFKRNEVVLEVQAEKVPTLEEAKKLVAEKTSSPEENVKIKKVDSKFGSRTFKIYSNVYESKEEKEAIEFKTKQEKEAEAKAEEERRKAEAEAKAAEEAAKAEAEKPAEEAPKEEAVEEKPEEKTE